MVRPRAVPFSSLRKQPKAKLKGSQRIEVATQESKVENRVETINKSGDGESRGHER
jgi:hypothetical protein